MRKIILLVTMVCIYSCKKDNKSTFAPTTSSQSIEGSWEVTSNINNIYTNGTWVSGDTVFYSPTESVFQFRADGWYFSIDSGIVTDSAQYLCYQDTIRFTYPPDTSIFKMTLTGNSLILFNKRIDYSYPPDTTLYETKLSFKKL